MERPPKENNSTNTKNQGKLFTAKKPNHRKPVIKQTLTSLYRIAKANPLLVSKDNATEDQVDDFGLTNIKLPKSILQPTIRHTADNGRLAVNFGPSSSNQNVKSLLRKSSINKNEQKSKLPSAPLSQTSSARLIKEKFTNNNMQLKRSEKSGPSTTRLEPKCHVQCNSSSSNSTDSVQVLTKRASKKEVTKTKRRSHSTEHYARKKGVCSTKFTQLTETKEATQSLNDIGKKSTLQPPIISTIDESVRTVTFKTPSAYKRRSISMTSCTPTPFHKRFASTLGHGADDLQKRLEKWLQKHQRPIDSYKQLKYFGLSESTSDCSYAELNEENKENIEGENIIMSTSYEDLKITPAGATSVSTITRPSENSYADNRTIALDALTDLQKLILDGYPHDQCEAWLGMIRQKCQDLDEEPHYWECRAAIEQTRGNITSAVECLRTAIVQGAEVAAIDQSLEQLLQKFSLLNISTLEGDKEDRRSKDQARIVLEARSVFKSCIIQFAVQEKSSKKKLLQGQTTSEKKFVATPVRRSTRQSRSKYTTTPNVKLCSSLHELDENIYSTLDFQSNTALLDKL